MAILSRKNMIRRYALLLGVLLLAWGPVASAATKNLAVTATNAVINFGSFAVLPSCANCYITISPSGVPCVQIRSGN